MLPFDLAVAAVTLRPGSYPLGLLVGMGVQAMGAAIWWLPGAMVPLAVLAGLTTLVAVPAEISFGGNLGPVPPRAPEPATQSAMQPRVAF